MAALVDAGADPDAIAATIAGLRLDGYAMHFERVQRCGVTSTWANVVVHTEHGDAPHVHRPAREIFDLLGDAELPERVRTRAMSVFRRLAEVEGRIHGIAADDVELHEVGALDSIIDVVGVCAALESLSIEVVRCSSIGLGTGVVRTAHGELPHPAPATIRLLTDARAPTHGLSTTLETATPTGAALMTVLASEFGPITTGSPVAVGYGAGTADPAERANVVQVVITDRSARGGAASGDAGGAPTMLIETNVDDVTGEVIAHTIAALLDAGAHDAWAVPIVMKKGRPGHTIAALCDDALLDTCRVVLVEQSGTLGVRASTVERWPQRRTTSTVVVDGHEIRVKIGDHRIKVEFDDAAAAASELGLPVRTVIDRAIAAAS